MTNKYTLLRIRKTTIYKLKILAAIKGESMINLMDRLADDEIKRLRIILPEPETAKKND